MTDQLPLLDVEAEVLGVEALAEAVAVVEVVDLVVVLEVLSVALAVVVLEVLSVALAVVVSLVLAVLALFALAPVLAVLALFALAAMHPVISIIPATLAVPATRRARRAGWGRRRLRAPGVAGVVSTFDSFGLPHCRGFDGVDDRLGTSESPQDRLGSPADLSW